LPARDLTRQYRKGYHDQNGTRNALVLTSRGCPFRCNFCACWKLLGGKYLVRSPESVVQEMTALPEDIEQIFFADDNTLHNVQHAWRLARLIRESGIRLKFSMFARADTVVKHPDLIRYLKECGLSTVFPVDLQGFRLETQKPEAKQRVAPRPVTPCKAGPPPSLSLAASLQVQTDL